MELLRKSGIRDDSSPSILVENLVMHFASSSPDLKCSRALRQACNVRELSQVDILEKWVSLHDCILEMFAGSHVAVFELRERSRAAFTRNVRELA